MKPACLTYKVRAERNGYMHARLLNIPGQSREKCMSACLLACAQLDFSLSYSPRPSKTPCLGNGATHNGLGHPHQ